MNMIRPVSDLRNNFADISKTVHETAQPVFLTSICPRYAVGSEREKSRNKNKFVDNRATLWV